MQFTENVESQAARERAKPFPTRGDNFETIGKLEAEVGLSQRQARSFKTHADWMNYLHGRKQSEQ